jgi:hypothetical protein
MSNPQMDVCPMKNNDERAESNGQYEIAGLVSWMGLLA